GALLALVHVRLPARARPARASVEDGEAAVSPGRGAGDEEFGRRVAVRVARERGEADLSRARGGEQGLLARAVAARAAWAPLVVGDRCEVRRRVVVVLRVVRVAEDEVARAVAVEVGGGHGGGAAVAVLAEVEGAGTGRGAVRGERTVEDAAGGTGVLGQGVRVPGAAFAAVEEVGGAVAVEVPRGAGDEAARSAQRARSGEPARSAPQEHRATAPGG